jgi:hypothetical protein
VVEPVIYEKMDAPGGEHQGAAWPERHIPHARNGDHNRSPKSLEIQRLTAEVLEN